MSPDPLPPKPPTPGSGRPGGPSPQPARSDAPMPPAGPPRGRDLPPRPPSIRPPVGRPTSPSPANGPAAGAGGTGRPTGAGRGADASSVTGRAARTGSRSGEGRAGDPPSSGHEGDDAPRTVTKKELVARIADRTAQTKVVARDIVQMFLDEIIRELGRGNRLEFREFGVFEIKERAARRAQNPRTLEKVDVPAKRVVKFRVAKAAKDAILGAK